MRIASPDELKSARHRLGWSLREMASALRLASAETKGADRVREMEDGRRPISGPVAVAVEAFAAGWRPQGFEDDMN